MSAPNTNNVFVTGLDDLELNGVDGLVFGLTVAGRGRVALGLQQRQRASLPPAFDGTLPQSRAMAFHFTQEQSGALDEDELADLAWLHFSPSDLERRLTGVLDGLDVESLGWITEFDQTDALFWEGTFVLLDTSWRAVTPTVSSANPLIVPGTLRTRPLATVSDGPVVERRSVSIRDRTGHGFAGYLAGFDPGFVGVQLSQIEVFYGPLALPFSYLNGLLYVYVSGNAPPETTRLDVYGGASISNQVTAGRIDPAGVTLDAGVANGIFTTSVGAHPPAAALSWQPRLTVEHDEAREYTVGVNGDTLRLVDREQTGVREKLGENADAWVLAPGIEIQSITDLSIEVTAGYRPGMNDSQIGAERVQRFTMGDINNTLPTGPVDTRLTIPTYDDDPYAQHATLWLPLWQFGPMTFPSYLKTVTDVDQSGIGGHLAGIEFWQNDALLSDFPVLAAAAIGCPITAGVTNEWFLHFGPNSYHGAVIPLLSLSFQPKDTVIEVDEPGVGVQPLSINGVSHPATFVNHQAQWVDPVTHEPLDANPENPQAADPIFGQARAVVKLWRRGSVDPETVWEEIVTGTSPNGTTMTFSDIDVDVTGAVKLAIGLEPVAASPSAINWGSLRITSSPVVTLQATRRPAISVSAAIPAQHLNGRLRVPGTDTALVFENCYSDAGGIEIDANLVGGEAIRGVDGLGPVKRPPLPTRGTLLLELRPGSEPWTTTEDLDDATVEWTFHPRYGA